MEKGRAVAVMILFPIMLSLVRMNPTVSVHLENPIDSGAREAGDLYFEDNDSFILFGNSMLEICLCKMDKGGLYSLTSKITGQELIRNQSSQQTIWRIYALEGFAFLNNWANEFSYNDVMTNSSLTVSLRWMSISDQWGNKHAIDVMTNITVSNNDPFTNWTINVDNRQNDLALRQVDFPFITGISFLGNDPNDDRFIYPIATGYVQIDPYDNLDGYETTYPGSGMSMQFASYYEEDVGGYYFGMHDNQGFSKKIQFYHQEIGLSLCFVHYPPLGIYNGTDFVLPYNLTIGVFVGKGWKDAAAIYKSWANQQWWCEEYFKNRQDVPDWWKALPGWLSVNPEWVDDSIAYLEHEGFPSKILFRYWDWMKGTFDKDYPEYFPPKVGESSLRDTILATHQHGDKSVLYFNGILCDNSTETYAEEAHNFQSVDEHGNPVLYSPTPIWTGRWMIDMCPQTEYWQDLILGLCETAVRQYDIDGVFLDCIPSVAPVLCFNSSHGHVQGSGNWWFQAVSALFMRVRENMRLLKPDFVAYGECVSEIYIPFLDGFWVMDNEAEINDYAGPISNCWQKKVMPAPIFQYIYHEYTKLIGGQTVTPYWGWGNYFPYSMAKSYVKGEIFGTNLFAPDYNVSAVSMWAKCTVAVQSFGYKYLVEGKLLGEVDVNVPKINITSQEIAPGWGTLYQNVTTPMVLNSVWESLDGSLGYVFVNFCSQSVTFNVEVDPRLFAWADFGRSGYALYAVDDGNYQLMNQTFDFPVECTLTIPPGETRLIVVVETGLRARTTGCAANVALLDHEDRRTGYDSNTSQWVAEIPNSTFVESQNLVMVLDPKKTEVTIRNPNDPYRKTTTIEPSYFAVEVAGTDTGHYHLELVNVALEYKSVYIVEGDTWAGKVDRYWLIVWTDGTIFQHYGPVYIQRTIGMGIQIIIPPEGVDPEDYSRTGGTIVAR